MRAQKGDKVAVAYRGMLKNGQQFDGAPVECPLEFIVGEYKLIAGFEDAVVGMAAGEEKTVEIPAEHAYGKRDPTRVRKFKKEVIAGPVTVQKGMTVRLRLQDARSILGTVLDIMEDGIIIDLNHPLAGQDVTFHIKVLSAQTPPPRKY